MLAQQEKIPEELREKEHPNPTIQRERRCPGIKLIHHDNLGKPEYDRKEKISEEQFRFMPRRSTTDAIFALRRLTERHKEMQVNIHMVFIDLEKVPRQDVHEEERSVTEVCEASEGDVRRIRDSSQDLCGHDRGFPDWCWTASGFGT
ncbi:hypothetical protein J437_LFUL019743 [Ladona fulva]|nr:hypothetical protein J437_LFUL019743 [Ladona fulva]